MYSLIRLPLLRYSYGPAGSHKIVLRGSVPDLFSYVAAKIQDEREEDDKPHRGHNDEHDDVFEGEGAGALLII